MQGNGSKIHSGDGAGARYWTTVIGTNDLRSSKDISRAIAEVKSRLAATSPAEAAGFDQWLHQQIFQLDRKEFFEVPVLRSDGAEIGQSEDHFLYARCACVLAGFSTYSEVLNGRRGFSDFAAIPLQGAELLLYAAEEVCTEVFKVEIDRLASCPLDAGSNSKYWF
jgi:uncharacterized protein DUF4240